MATLLMRPLFEEPSSSCEREDPWSGPKGFMLGGWSLPSGTTWEMAEQYFDAANLLLEAIQDGQMEDYRVGVPTLFLYRHWIELAVKSIVEPFHGHDLTKLSNAMAEHLEKRGIQVPLWVTARLEEVARIDQRSTAFRYAENSIDGEIYVSLPHLRDAMKLLHVALSSVSRKGRFPPESLFALIANDPTAHQSYLASLGID